MTNVLVTGGCGFIGSQFVEHVLRKTNWNVTVLDGLTYAGDTARLTEIFGETARVKVVWHDLRSPISPSVSKRLGSPDYIVHFAAQSHVDRSISDPLDFILGNPATTAHLLEWVRQSLVTLPQQIIQFSTDEVYGPAPAGVMSVEWDPILPSNPYSASKAAQEAIAIAYWRTYGLPISIVNVMNVFGPRQHPEKFMPKAIRAIKAGEPVTVHGRRLTIIEGEARLDPERFTEGRYWEASSRVWIHTADVSSALLRILDRPPTLYGEGNGRPDRWHVAGPDEVDVYTMCQWIGDALGRTPLVEWVDYHSTRPGHDHRYALDSTKIRTELGWSTSQTTKEAVLDVVAWTMQHPHWL